MWNKIWNQIYYFETATCNSSHDGAFITRNTNAIKQNNTQHPLWVYITMQKATTKKPVIDSIQTVISMRF